MTKKMKKVNVELDQKNPAEFNAITVKIRRYTKQASIPKYITEHSAGLDFVAISCEYDREEKCQVYHTGISVEIPEGYVGLLFPKSGISKRTQYLTNCVGVIDSDYRGEVKAKFKGDALHTLFTMKTYGGWIWRKLLSKFILHSNTYAPGDAIFQMIILPYPKVKFLEVEELSSTERGDKGFGEMDLIQNEEE